MFSGRRSTPETPAFVHQHDRPIAAAGGEPSREDLGDGWAVERCACGTRHVRIDGGGGDPAPDPSWHTHGAGAPCPAAPVGVTVQHSVTGEYWVSRCTHGFEVPWWPADQRVPHTGVPSPFAARPSEVAA